MASYVETVPVAATAYGRFSGRVRAFIVDWIIIVLLLVVALFVTVSANSDRIGRILGFTFVGVWLLYEPVLVSLTGSTVGHYLCNLRVVDDRTHGNVSFLKAVGRLVIKTALGLYSFVTMATTLRHQAVHDLLTRSTVQIRDRAKASPSQYVAERTELLSPAMPSVGRRLMVIVAYLVGIFVVTMFAFYLVDTAGHMSHACLEETARCSSTEKWILIGIQLPSTIASVVCIIQGWRGRLFGCRVRPQPQQVSPDTPS